MHHQQRSPGHRHTTALVMYPARVLGPTRGPLPRIRLFRLAGKMSTFHWTTRVPGLDLVDSGTHA